MIVAAAQASPVFLDLHATIDKIDAIATEARKRDARLLVFPEAFVPAYPDWVWLVPARDKALLEALYTELLLQAVTIPGPETERLCEIAQRTRLHLAIGINELNSDASGTTLFNSLIYINDVGRVLGVHRTLVPTGAERLVWGQGDGSSLVAHDTRVGRLGGLIGWENYMPLARYAMYAAGTQVYVAASWDHGEPWVSTLRHIGKEGRMFVIGCTMALRRSDLPARFGFADRYPADREWINPGGSVIVDPEGQILAGPITECEDLLCAEIDLDRSLGTRWLLDVAGHYARPDIFHLSIDRTAHPIAVDAPPASLPDEPLGQGT
jgi:nitrilase